MAETAPPEGLRPASDRLPAPEPPAAAEGDDEHGRLYWLVHNTVQGCAAFLQRHTLLFVLISVSVVFAAFVARAPLHHGVIAIRRRLFLVALGAPFAWAVYRSYRFGGLRRRVVLTIFLIAFLPSVVLWGDDVHEYLSLYVRYRTLPKVELETLPVTDHERTHPLYSIYNFARRAIAENSQPTLPRVVRHGDGYEWTAGVEPAYAYYQFLGSVNEVLAVSATTASPRFSAEHRHHVQFQTGEKMLFGSNTHTAAVRAFGVWQYFNDEPSDLIYIQDDDAEYVQVVSLIRWRGFFFPRREFGGVQVIHQHAPSVGGMVRKMLFGAGEWIPPEKIPQHPFLLGQNIVPYAVMRYAAESFRFQGGLFAPFPGMHNGDVRIPDQKADENPQPFVCYFRIPQEAKLYGFFALEPYNPSQFGLNTMVFFPGDGQGAVFYYQPQKHGLSIIGVSAVNAVVRESRKQYTWQLSHPAENRPYIKVIDGETRFSWLSTVVTEGDSHGQPAGGPGSKAEVERDFVSGSTPEIVLTDGIYSVPVWVTSLDPSTWPQELQAKLEPIWEKAPRGTR